jgi:hypothetical protein
MYIALNIRFVSFSMAFILCMTSYAKSSDQFDKNSKEAAHPISQVIIQEGIDTSNGLETGVINEIKTGEQNIFAIKKVQFKTKSKENILLLFVHILHNRSGSIYVFEWNASKSDQENYSVIDNKLFYYGVTGTNHRNECLTISYSLEKIAALSSSITFQYKEQKGYSKLDLMTTPLWSCIVNQVITNQHYKNKGLATMAIQELVNFTFKTRLACCMQAYIDPSNDPSLIVFKKNGFKEMIDITNEDEPNYLEFASWERKGPFITLDAGDSYLVPVTYRKSNHYISSLDSAKKEN